MTLHDLSIDSALGCRVAASPSLARAVLAHPDLGVRPPDEPVPAVLNGTVAGAIFARLVRMRDDPAHAPLKAALATALDSIPAMDIRHSVNAVACTLVPEAALPLDGAGITRFIYTVPSAVLGHWFGIAPDVWNDLGEEVLSLTRCIAPGGTAVEIAAGIAAAEKLERRIRDQLSAPGCLLRRMMTALEATDAADASSLLVANAVGLFFQACEGCAGLIGQALLLAGNEKEDHDSDALLTAVLKASPPIRNTRRFAARDTTIAGCPLHAGEAVLAVLSNETLAFGHGRHACPGERWARIIATAGIEHLLKRTFDWKSIGRYRWRRSLNARVPEFY